MCIATARVKHKHKQDNNKTKTKTFSMQSVLKNNIIVQSGMPYLVTAPFCSAAKTLQERVFWFADTRRIWLEGVPSAEHFSS